MKVVFTLLVVALAGVGLSTSPAASAATQVADPPVSMDAWAWCGVNPDLTDATTALAAVKSMAQNAGIDATFGPCRPGDDDYTPVTPGDRYASPATYMKLVLLNAQAGMKTVVYDARLYDANPSVRVAAITFWQPVLANIAAWDLGDEYGVTFGPPAARTAQWNVLVQRWNTVLNTVTPLTGVRPYANHLWWATDIALTDLPGVGGLLSYTRYDADKGVSVAQAMSPKVDKLMCGVNAMTHQVGPNDYLTPTTKTITDDMQSLIKAGCNQFLVFGGFPVYDDTDSLFGQTIIDRTGSATPFARSVLQGALTTSFAASQPARLLETRTGPGTSTVDGQFYGIGAQPADTVRELTVAGRAGVPKDADAVALNVTVDAARGPGFLTVYPCGSPRPTAASLNYVRGSTLSNAVVSKVGVDGKVCIYAMATIDLVVDLNGYFPAGSTYVSQPPARVLETRTGPGITTTDGVANGIGVRTADTVTELPLAGRVGMPFDLDSVVLNVTVAAAQAPGFLTVYPCGTPRPTAASLNYMLGSTLSNTVVAKAGVGGAVCIYTLSTVDLVVDVNGYFPLGSSFVSQQPARVLETRVGPGISTADGQLNGIGQRLEGTVTELPVTGRVGIPANANSVVLNVTVDAAQAAGFLTVFPCGSPRPTAASLNYVRGSTLSNAVVAKVGINGQVCIFTMSTTELVVDVNGYFPAKVGALPPV